MAKSVEKLDAGCVTSNLSIAKSLLKDLFCWRNRITQRPPKS
ncbi:hypothetical protein [Escherichia phage IMM-001]|nr:hypothetical protein [Escherichia phage IMM-001]